MNAIEELRQQIPEETLRRLAAAELWAQGDLSYLLKPGAQTRAYELVHRWEAEHPLHPGPIVLHLHRGAGKSMLLGILAFERAVKYPNQTCRIGGPDEKNTVEAYEPIFRWLLTHCPQSIRVDKRGTTYSIRNSRWGDKDAVSRIILFGCHDAADSQRNKRSNWIAVDEAREVGNADYVVTSVLGPHFVAQSRPLMIVSSTSPNTLAHEFWDFVDRGKAEGRYLLCPCTENEGFTEADEQVLVAICRGKNTIAWRREALCERVFDEAQLVIPSFSRNQKAIVRESERPEWFFPFEFGDMGFVDCAAFLFAYIDYLRQKLVVEDEIVQASLGTEELVRLVGQKERELYSKTPKYRHIRRWADATPRELDDLRKGDLFFLPAKQGKQRWDKWTGLARLESLCADGSIEIHPRCKSLIYQLGEATKNEHRTDIQRVRPKEDQDSDSPVMGHQDALWALAYGVWQVEDYWTESPFPPPYYGPDVFLPPEKRVPKPGRLQNVTHEPIRASGLSGVTHRPIKAGGLRFS